MLKFKLLLTTKLLRQFVFINKLRALSMKSFEGTIPIKANDLNLNLTLLGGQSFRWEKCEQQRETTSWCGVAYDAYWIIEQNPSAITYKVYPVDGLKAKEESIHSKNDEVFYYENLLKRYLRTDFDLQSHALKWKNAHKHFAEIATNMKAVRVLNQEPFENILSFMCSQNNNIKRISSMIRWLCCKYGQKIGTFQGREEYTFPSLNALHKHQKELETNLREAKFGYRAKFISQTVSKIAELGGEQWFQKLRTLPYDAARLELVHLPGIGFKVADCICLMSLNHLESVPIDTHIYKIAQSAYLPHLAKVKSVTPKIYEEISKHFRTVYGPYAGWTQAILFCSELQQFQTENSEVKKSTTTKKKRK